MPTIGNMLEMVDLLQLRPLGARSLDCVSVRNKNSKCRMCAEACMVGAISIECNSVTVDLERCVNCGCCVAVCPDDALFTLNPTRKETIKRAIDAADKASGMTVVACSRKASRGHGDPDRFAEVPCLGHVSEHVMLDLAALGIDDIVLVDGNCKTCVYGSASRFVDKSVDVARELLESAGAQVLITRMSEFPSEAAEEAQASFRGRDRRAAFRQTGSYMRAVAGNIAQKAFGEGDGAEDGAMALSLRLPVGRRGKFSKVEPTQNYRLLDDMEASSASIGDAAASGGKISTRRFGDVRIDAQLCSGCGMCMTFCPTGALRYSELEEHPDATMRYVEFQASDCTQCNLCSDVCMRGAVDVSPEVALSSLYDFEPKLMGIRRPKNDNLLSDLRRRFNR